jgi:ubiquinone/menaquinone biosynthesis C-methylase UbiE
MALHLPGESSSPIRWLVPLATLAVVALLTTSCSVASRLDYSNIASRQGWQRTDEVIEILELSPGDVVADLGSGDGYFSFFLADAVGPTGRVYAVDVDPEPLAELRAEIERRGYQNITVVEGGVDDARLPAGVVDLVFLCNAYHHFDERVAYFTKLHAALAPGARMAVLDGRSEGAATWFVPDGHWLEPGVLVGELSAAGFTHTASHDFLPMQTFDLFNADPPVSNAAR